MNKMVLLSDEKIFSLKRVNRLAVIQENIHVIYGAENFTGARYSVY